MKLWGSYRTWPAMFASEKTTAKYQGEYEDVPSSLRQDRMKSAGKLYILSEYIIPHFEIYRYKTCDIQWRGAFQLDNGNVSRNG